MRILHVIHSVDPRSGGPSHAIRAIVRYQVAAGQDVSLLTTSIQSAEPWDDPNVYRDRVVNEPDVAGAEIFVAPAWGRRRPWSRYGYSRAGSRWLWSRLCCSETRPDVVHIHATFSHPTSVAAALARRAGVPYIVRPAGNLNRRCYSRGYRPLKDLFVRLFLQRDLARAALLQAMSPAEADELTAWLGGDGTRVRIVPHGIDLPAAMERAEAGRLVDERYPALHGRRFILFLSRIDAKKRPELVVEALAAAGEQHRDLALLIGGHQTEHCHAVNSAIRRLGLGERVVFAGFVEGTLKQAALTAAEAFVLPSIDENFGVAVIEAMAHGTPAIVTPGVATHIHVDVARAGLTVEGTPAALADALKAVFREDRSALGERGRAYVQEHLGWPAVTEQLLAVYRQACAENRACLRSTVEAACPA